MRGKGTSLVAQQLKNLPAMQEMQVRSLGREDPLEAGMATYSSILAWKIPWTEGVGHDWSDWACTHAWGKNRCNFDHVWEWEKKIWVENTWVCPGLTVDRWLDWGEGWSMDKLFCQKNDEFSFRYLRWQQDFKMELFILQLHVNNLSWRREFAKRKNE